MKPASYILHISNDCMACSAHIIKSQVIAAKVATWFVVMELQGHI